MDAIIIKRENDTLPLKKHVGKGYSSTNFSPVKFRGIVSRNADDKRVFKESREIGYKISQNNLYQELNRNKIIDFCISTNSLNNLGIIFNKVSPVQVGVTSNFFVPIFDIGLSSVFEIMNVFSKRLFMTYSNLWKAETKYLSLFQKIIEHPAYQKIIEMDNTAIPFILEEINKGEVDFCWDYALRKITGENPVADNRTSLEEINLDWLVWGKNKGII